MIRAARIPRSTRLIALVACLAVLTVVPASLGAAPAPAWMTRASVQLAGQWFPGTKPASVSFHLGTKLSTVTLKFRHAISCNCPAPPGAAVTLRCAVFTLDTHTHTMKSFEGCPTSSKRR
jgi:hypothetical protein